MGGDIEDEAHGREGLCSSRWKSNQRLGVGGRKERERGGVSVPTIGPDGYTRCTLVENRALVEARIRALIQVHS